MISVQLNRQCLQENGSITNGHGHFKNTSKLFFCLVLTNIFCFKSFARQNIYRKICSRLTFGHVVISPDHKQSSTFKGSEISQCLRLEYFISKRLEISWTPVA